jgi:adenine-specific DNA-methyltransferase
MKQTDQGFSASTIEWQAQTKLSHRQALGQYMTPTILRTELLKQLELFPGARVLDPGVGTGEFLKQAAEICPGMQLFGWDIDEAIIKVARENVPQAKLDVRSALDPYEGESFDFVIGNPPYFEMKPTPELRARFAKVISGRANIYALFFQAGLEALRPGGTLAYVVPPSMNVGAYFKALRRYISSENSLQFLKIYTSSDLFQDAQTSVQIIVIRKHAGPSKHLVTLTIGNSDEPLLFEDPLRIESALNGKSTLWSLGYEAVTGTVVWNQHKDSLTNNEAEGVATLIYPRNIQNGKIEIKPDKKKPQYFSSTKLSPQTGPAIVVNRIIGSVGKGSVNSALLESRTQFFAENHINVIRPRNGVEQKCSIEELFRAVQAPKTAELAKLITGNTQLSATEWNYLIPFPNR